MTARVLMNTFHNVHLSVGLAADLAPSGVLQCAEQVHTALKICRRPSTPHGWYHASWVEMWQATKQTCFLERGRIHWRIHFHKDGFAVTYRGAWLSNKFSHQELGTQIFAAMTFGTIQCTTFSACCDVTLNNCKSSPMTSKRGITDTPFLLLHLQTHEGE